VNAGLRDSTVRDTDYMKSPHCYHWLGNIMTMTVSGTRANATGTLRPFTYPPQRLSMILMWSLHRTMRIRRSTTMWLSFILTVMVIIRHCYIEWHLQSRHNCFKHVMVWKVSSRCARVQRIHHTTISLSW
jgi:hypothetical protein